MRSSPLAHLNVPYALGAALAATLFGLGLAPARADVVVTAQGLTLEGKVTELEGGSLQLETASGCVTLRADQVVSRERGAGPLERSTLALAALDPADVPGRYRLALTAQEEGSAQVAQVLLEEVLRLDPDHAAARRALGYERVAGTWLSGPDARRAQGLVLYAGTWMLPAEVEAASAGAPAERAAPTLSSGAARDTEKVLALLRALAGGEAALRAPAQTALARTPAPLLVAAGLQALYDSDAALRIEACRLLGDLGDESALRALVFSGARDVDSRVRREAVLAAQSLGHDDTAVPFVRALGSDNLQVVANAAQALALLGDLRAADYIVRRLESHGSSTRNYVAFMSQISYVRDYDVEIAQASNIANPDVATLVEGVILDIKVVDAAYTRTWVEPILVKAYSDLVGQSLGSREEVRAYQITHRGEQPAFASEPRRERAPRRSGS